MRDAANVWTDVGYFAGNALMPIRALTAADVVTVSPNPLPVSGTFWQVTQPVSVAAVVHVDDNAGSLTVDGTFWPTTAAAPASQRLSDGAAFYDGRQIRALTSADQVTIANASLAVTGTFWQATQPISAVSLPLPTNAAQEHVTAAGFHSVRLTDGAAFYDGRSIRALTTADAITTTFVAGNDFTKAEDAGHVSGDRGAFVLAVRNDLAADLTSADADYSPMAVDVKGRQMVREINWLIATTISAANATVTLTIAAAGAGLFHYITSIEIINLNPTVTAIAAAATNLAYTTTNIPGAPIWNCGTLLAAGAEKVVTRVTYPGGIKTTAAATATTFVAPAIGAGGLCRINVSYYIAP